MKEFNKKYYISSFFWSVFQKAISAIYAFLSVPILLEFYGKSEYGLLGIATSCNAYMHLLDLGMNHGASRFYARWRKEGKDDLINRVARTNITFYNIIAAINILFLVVLAFLGENLFSVTYEQFLQLRNCLLILATFSIFSWGTTTFSQLLVADGQLSFTLIMQCIVSIIKCLLIVAVFLFNFTLTTYFFLLTFIVTSLIFPYVVKCRKDRLIDSISPAFYWNDFKEVMTFSLSLFALSLFQMTAKDTRPIILSLLAPDGAGAVADYSIIASIPSLIITIGSTFTGIFLPKTSSMVVKNDQKEISGFAYTWTLRTTIITCLLTFPFIICAKELIVAYVGIKYVYLTPWLILWCFTVLIQIHTTPLGSLVFAYGKMKAIVVTTAIYCVISMLINASLCHYLAVGSAVLGYAIYVCLVIGTYYVYFNKHILHLSRIKMVWIFLRPTFIAIILAVILMNIPINYFFVSSGNARIDYLFVCIVKSTLWFVPYIVILQLSKIIDFRFLVKKNG